jgi:hypothetical protein
MTTFYCEMIFQYLNYNGVKIIMNVMLSDEALARRMMLNRLCLAYLINVTYNKKEIRNILLRFE